MPIRQGTVDDIAGMVALSERKRSAYERQAPLFWRKAANASEVQSRFFQELLNDSNCICLVDIDDMGMAGFVIGRLMDAPPVYDPGGSICMIDDFVVRDPSLWPTVGKGLKERVEAEAMTRCAVLSVTVCGHHDQSERTMLQHRGDQCTSEWYVSMLGTPRHPGSE